MKIQMRNLVLLFILTTTNAQAAPVAPSVPGSTGGGVIIRGFSDHEKYSLLAEVGGFNESDNRSFREITLGGYWQQFENLKLGLFYRQANGLRHDNDWISSAGTWSWINTNSRPENFYIFDATPKMLLSEQLVGELKVRYLYNAFNNEQTLQVRPGVTYFLTKNDQAFWNIFAQLEADFPLNYGVQSIYEEWAYLGALYSIHPGIELGGFFAEQWQTWGSSATYSALGAPAYVNTAQTTVVCLLLIFHM